MFMPLITMQQYSQIKYKYEFIKEPYRRLRNKKGCQINFKHQWEKTLQLLWCYKYQCSLLWKMFELFIECDLLLHKKRINATFLVFVLLSSMGSCSSNIFVNVLETVTKAIAKHYSKYIILRLILQIMW